MKGKILSTAVAVFRDERVKANTTREISTPKDLTTGQTSLRSILPEKYQQLKTSAGVNLD